MSRRMFGRQRANTATDAISKPTLTFSDAAPRDDLQALGQLPTANLQPVAYGGGWPLRQETPKDANSFDFRTMEPPEEVLKSRENENGISEYGTIGIALGSPSVVPPPYATIKSYDSPVINGGQGTMDQKGDSLRRKPSKWKKFGGIFKGKQNPPKQANLPFYQVRINDQSIETASPDIRSQEISPVHTRHGSQQEPARLKKGSNHIDLWPRGEEESRPDKRFEKENFRDNQNPFRTERNDGTNANNLVRSRPSASSPVLNIDIPEIEMERYSVMFGSVLGNKQPPGLLARRSRTLDKLKVTPEDPNLLQSPKPQRRATSPSLSKSPYVTLFPTPGDNPASSGPGYAMPYRRPQRSQTAPTEPRDGMRSKYNTGHPLVPISSKTLSTTPQHQQDSSYGSPTSPTFSVDEIDLTAHRKKHVKSYVDEKKEPAWNMMTTTAAAVAKRTESPESTTASSLWASTSAISSKSSAATTPEDVAPMTPPKDYPPTPPKDHASSTGQRGRLDRAVSPHVSSSSSRNRSQSATRAASSSAKSRKGSGSGSGSGSTTSHRVSPKIANSGTTLSPLETPTMEVSIARSISVSRSRGPKQALVPLGAAPEEFDAPNERLVERQALVPTVVDVRRGHRPGKSQHLLIETV